MCHFFHCYFAVCLGYTLYNIWTWERFFIICFQNGIFSEKLHVFCPVSYFSNMLHNGFRHADGFSFSFVLIQKKRKRKEKIKATSPGLLRKGRSGAEKWTRFVALRSDSIFQRRPSIPTLTPPRLGRSFFLRQGASLLALYFGFALPSAFII